MTNNSTKLLINVLFIFLFIIPCRANENLYSDSEIEQFIHESMKKEKIPGLCLIIIKDDSTEVFKNFGYADLDEKIPVTENTLFELGSCSKAFTALAALHLEQQGLIKLDDYISDYFPWFHVKYKAQKVRIRLRQLLHHTSGIPWNTLSNILPSTSSDALVQTVKKIVDAELNEMPGSEFEYATANYDIIGAIIEKVTSMSFENYLQENIFDILGLNNTTVGVGEKNLPLAPGYKTSYFFSQKYEAPVYRGNYPAGYIISNGIDISKWLKIQTGWVQTAYDSLVGITHIPDMTVPPGYNMASYAMGWYVNPFGSREVFHGGLNPNYSTYIGFKPELKIGVAILTNSNSGYVLEIGSQILNYYSGSSKELTYISKNNFNKVFSICSYIIGFVLIGVFVLIVFIILDIVKGNRIWEHVSWSKIRHLFIVLVIVAPFIIGVYYVPRALVDFSWQATLVWTPISFPIAMILFVAFMVASYIVYVLTILFPHENKYKGSVPIITILSLLSGIANTAVILIIVVSVGSDRNLLYILYYFCLALIVNIGARKVVQTRLIKLTLDVVYDYRMKLLTKVFSTTYQKFEKIDRGKIYSTLNDDTNTIANFISVFAVLITSIITIIGAFIYLSTIALWATVVTLASILLIAVLYAIIGGRTKSYYEKVRNTEDLYMDSLNGMLDGFKELSINNNKKCEFYHDLSDIANTYREEGTKAGTVFFNTFIIGESLLIVVLAIIAFIIPKLFPYIQLFVLYNFILVILYLIGPIKAILNSIPDITRIKVSWDRIQGFLNDLKSDFEFNAESAVNKNGKMVDKISLDSIIFEYKNEDEHENFKLGPISLEIEKGEVLFIIGGNGSGKTTLAKILTGLYKPQQGIIKINNNTLSHLELGEYFSTVFSPFYVFKKLYNIDIDQKEQEIAQYLKLLDLDKKVLIKNNSFSTLDLSNGQRKRLALLKCYLEDSPIYLFDEWAADQDPEYRKFFYRNLLPTMKKSGKIVIAITHDDYYFDVADKIIKLDMGHIDFINQKSE